MSLTAFFKNLEDKAKLAQTNQFRHTLNSNEEARMKIKKPGKKRPNFHATSPTHRPQTSKKLLQQEIKTKLKSMGKDSEITNMPSFDKYGDMYTSLKYKWKLVVERTQKKDEKLKDPLTELKKHEQKMFLSDAYTFNQELTPNYLEYLRQTNGYYDEKK